MREVNLSRRPFVNRRPILRLAGLLWILGAVLLMFNVRLFGSHWKGSAVNRQRLTEVGQETREARKKFDLADRALRRVDVLQQDRQTMFLNSLIASRTFPWSALFEDLEEVLPRDVKLLSVKPEVKLSAEPEKPRRRRAVVPRPGRRGRSGASGTVTNAADAADAADDDESTTAAAGDPAPQAQRRNKVELQLSTVAKSEEALMGFIDSLYASPLFQAPYLPGEVRNLESGGTSAAISVIYLTQPEQLSVDTAVTANAGEPIERPMQERAVMAAEDIASGGSLEVGDEDGPEDRVEPEVATIERALPPIQRGGSPAAASPQARPLPGSATAQPPAATGGLAVTQPAAPPAADVETPEFVEPEASATPRLRRGKLLSAVEPAPPSPTSDQGVQA